MSGYKDLLTYQQSEKIYDLTVELCGNATKPASLARRVIQAARSGKQNIVEGYSFKSLKGYIKLLGVSRGSLEELLEDFLDFARIHGVELWTRKNLSGRAVTAKTFLKKDWNLEKLYNYQKNGKVNIKCTI